jgi:hypothetical protein
MTKEEKIDYISMNSNYSYGLLDLCPQSLIDKIFDRISEEARTQACIDADNDLLDSAY